MENSLSKYIILTEENMAKEHICCAFSDKKCAAGYELKKEWLTKECKLPVKCVLQNKRISPDSVRFVQIRLRIGTNSIKLYQFGTDLL